MQLAEISKLMGYIEIIDPRIAFDELKVMAWSNVLSNHLPYDLAIEFVNQHYKNSQNTIMPSDLNLMFRNSKQMPIEVEGYSQPEGWVKATPEQAAYWADKMRKDLADFGKLDTPYKPSMGY